MLEFFPTQALSYEYCKNFLKSTDFEEHLRTAAFEEHAEASPGSLEKSEI